MEWTTACPDWADRLRARKSIIPKPIYPDEAEAALNVFKQLRIVDAPHSPTFGEACEPWVFDFVAAIFGAYDAETGRRLIREAFMLIPKKNSKSTIAAGIMITALVRNWRTSAELIILAPTIEIANNSYNPARDMVRADEELSELLHVQDHVRTITHRMTNATLKVVAADNETVGGKKGAWILIDEEWIFGKRPKAGNMFREATGGLASRPEGIVIKLSTQSDEPPAGVFKKDLARARAVRDGKIVDPKFLPVIYEFPEEMQKAKAYLDPANFHFVNPNLGRSVDEEFLTRELMNAQFDGEESLQSFLAKHFNIEIGLVQADDNWAGAEFWEDASEQGLTLDQILERIEVAVVGIDGGGLDDLLGLVVLGREKETRRWLHWSHAWAHKVVLKRRKDIATKLDDLKKLGDLTLVEQPGDDVDAVAEIICRIRDLNLLAEEKPIGVDPAGVNDIVDELTAPDCGFEIDQIVAVSQGWRLNSAIKTTERKVAGGELLHCGQELMAWCVGNAKVVPIGNAVLVTKQASGKAKIDPLMATFNAVALMSLNPEARNASVYESRGIRVL
ncbi:terminase large subunit [Dyella marensis]|uniref:Phage terminase-like protein, large subunit, contains N-terminal HTH domain n=1 Tax=Dyella marensis TaxID=500610 RepID=A0A1I1ZYM2_9GAMM|nr:MULTISPECIES: terminase large subunit [Dyella]SFE36771.1 Phage terminase-like protein, large subunit, contains N-terminal HTH domain [Dyella marensis]